ncbi:MAG: hypothetical protein BGO68_01300 [Candidatus Amoebophilus sp. 36-38]|nr:MAG: hypothetical protein BGO68_01300 [Candidatus Amoebophilus sp. 36-38]
MQQEPTMINHLIQKMIKESPHRHKLEEATIIHAWHQMMPHLVSRRTVHISVKQHQVFIKVNSAPLRQELQNTKQQILAVLQNACKDYVISDLIFIS